MIIELRERGISSITLTLEIVDMKFSHRTCYRSLTAVRVLWPISRTNILGKQYGQIMRPASCRDMLRWKDRTRTQGSNIDRIDAAKEFLLSLLLISANSICVLFLTNYPD
jgi:hypothetical protein